MGARGGRQVVRPDARPLRGSRRAGGRRVRFLAVPWARAGSGKSTLLHLAWPAIFPAGRGRDQLRRPAASTRQMDEDPAEPSCGARRSASLFPVRPAGPGAGPRRNKRGGCRLLLARVRRKAAGTRPAAQWLNPARPGRQGTADAAASCRAGEATAGRGWPAPLRHRAAGPGSPTSRTGSLDSLAGEKGCWNLLTGLGPGAGRDRGCWSPTNAAGRRLRRPPSFVVRGRPGGHAWKPAGTARGACR